MKNWWTKFHKFGAISSAEQMAFLTAVFVLLIIKIGLKLLPFSTFKRIFAFVSITKQRTTTATHHEKNTTKAVLRAADALPFAVTCLPRALAVKFLLKKSDSILLKIGVQKKPENDQFEAHAWVEKNNTEIIIGNLPEFSYVPLWEWK